jgi:hypothetical protein
MKSTVTRIRHGGSFRLEVHYDDALTAVLDFTKFLAEHNGPVVETLRDSAVFSAVRLEDGVVTWPNGFDICPDVLRFWSEQGHVCSDHDTDAHFESQRSLSAS